MKRLAIILLSILLAMPTAKAKKVDLTKAEQVAEKHVQRRRRMTRAPKLNLRHAARKRGFGPGVGIRPPGRLAAGTNAPENNAPVYYVFDDNESDTGGFVIVSGDDIAKPILGYSDDGNYDRDNLPPEFQYWMEYLQNQIEYAEAEGISQSESVKQEWAGFADEGSGVPMPAATVSALIQTKWNQRAPYYNSCPLYNGSRTLTGCVATAQAQIMNYWKFPATGSGYSADYTTTTNNISVPAVNRNVNYDWDYMSDTYPVYGADADRKNAAVATLMHHAGASAKMDYTPTSSAAVLPSFSDFGYTETSIKVRSVTIPGTNIVIPGLGYSDTEWEQMLRNEIDAGRPVYYTGVDSSGGAHAFVCDGYNNSGMFHFNWGWGGVSDGYYVANAVSTGYNFSQTMTVNIKPVPVLVAGIAIDKSAETIQIGNTVQLAATVTPANASNRKVTWQSSNPSVATVTSGGLVTAISPDVANITATTEDGDKTASFAVTIAPPSYSITYNLNGGTGWAGPASYTENGTAITLGAPARTNSIFKGWYESNNFTGTAITEIPAGSTGNKILYAKWFCIDGYYTDSATSCSLCPHITAE